MFFAATKAKKWRRRKREQDIREEEDKRERTKKKREREGHLCHEGLEEIPSFHELTKTTFLFQYQN